MLAEQLGDLGVDVREVRVGVPLPRDRRELTDLLEEVSGAGWICELASVVWDLPPLTVVVVRWRHTSHLKCEGFVVRAVRHGVELDADSGAHGVWFPCHGHGDVVDPVADVCARGPGGCLANVDVLEGGRQEELEPVQALVHELAGVILLVWLLVSDCF